MRDVSNHNNLLKVFFVLISVHQHDLVVATEVLKYRCVPGMRDVSNHNNVLQMLLDALLWNSTAGQEDSGLQFKHIFLISFQWHDVTVLHSGEFGGFESHPHILKYFHLFYLLSMSRDFDHLQSMFEIEIDRLFELFSCFDDVYMKFFNGTHSRK